jgi:hypothetical protein
LRRCGQYQAAIQALEAENRSLAKLIEKATRREGIPVIATSK